MKHILFSLLLLLAAVPALAGEPADMEDLRVNVDIQNGTLQDVLNALFDQGVSYAGVDAEDIAGISVRARNMRIRQLVESLTIILSREPHNVAIWLQGDEEMMIVFRRRNDEEVERDLEAERRHMEMELERREAEVEADIREILRPPLPPDDLLP